MVQTHPGGRRLRLTRGKLRVLVVIAVAVVAIMLPSSAPGVEIFVTVRIEALNGIVTSTDGTVNCFAGTSGGCMVKVRYGKLLTLRASPKQYFVFAGWRGTCVGAAPTCVFQAGRVTSIRARFRRVLTEVAVTVSGPGFVVSEESAGISCGEDGNRDACEASFGAGTSVTLRALSAAGGAFVRWDGLCTSRTPRCRIALGSRRVEMAAVFDHLNLAEGGARTLTVRVTEALRDERNVVTSNPGGIECPTTCSASFTAETEVKLHGGRAFGAWTSGCHGTGVCILVLDTDAIVGARAAGPAPPPPAAGLGVSVSVSGRGMVTSRGIRCGGVTGTLFDCQALYYPRSTILLRAKAAGGSRFGGWGGFCSGKKLRCTLTVAASMTVTAFFRPDGG